MAIAPPALRIGDAIGIIAPAGPTDLKRLGRGLTLIPQSYPVRLPASLREGYQRHSGPRYLADSDARRIDECNAMLRDPDIRTIMMARGGYGIMRILPQLDAAALRADPKPIVGFSDGTALLSWAWHAGVRGIHGPVAQQFADVRGDDIAQLFAMLTHPNPAGTLSWSLHRGAAGHAPIEGQLFGGNANLISHLLATPWQMPSVDGLMCLEDVGEKPYAIDRYLTHLGLADGLCGTRAIIAGDFTRCMDPLPAIGAPDDPSEALAVLAERADALAVPCWYGAEFGHGANNSPWPFGARARLDGGTLTLLDAAVS